MAEKAASLELAAFLDSTEAGALAVPREDLRRTAEALLEGCYGTAGKKPRLLDGEDVAVVLRHVAGRLRAKDPLAERVPEVVAAFLDHLEATQVVPQAYEVRRALDAAAADFLALVRSGRNVEHATARSEAPFVHGASKLGRNDPCSCGSGKKYKKCHGKNA